MADEQKTLSRQINSLATRVAQEIKELKSSVGTGATGTVKTVNGNGPNTDGNITLTAEDVNALSCDGGGHVDGNAYFEGTVEAQKYTIRGNDLSTAFVAVIGDRGRLSGYQTTGDFLSDTITLTLNSPDFVSYWDRNNLKLTVSNSTSGKSWVKVVALNTSSQVTLDTSWRWAGGSVPTFATNSLLILCWNSTFGIAAVTK